MNQRDQGDNGPASGAQATRPHGSDDAATSFSALLRGYRKRAGLTQETLAEKAGLGVNTIGNLERGVSQPYRDTVAALSTALELSADEQAAFTAAANHGRAALIRTIDPHDIPSSSLTGHVAGETAHTEPHAASTMGRWPSAAGKRARGYGMRTGGVLIAAVLVVVLGVTMVVRPPDRGASRGREAQPRASGSDCGTARGWPVLCMRAHGTPVYALQYLLNGYDPTYNLTVDGVFGPRTRNAVQDFQRRNSIRGDAAGIVGARTWTALASQGEVHLHSAGSGVLALQYLLDHGRATPDRLNVDGSYGPRTQHALAAAEGALGLQRTDTVTPAVWRTLLCATSSGCRATHGN